MLLDMVDHRCDGDAALLLASAADRLGGQASCPDTVLSSPAVVFVQPAIGFCFW